MTLEAKAIEVVKAHAVGTYDIVSAARSPWDDEAVVAVTIKYRSRSIVYEVWEVSFTVDGAWEGEGTFGVVANANGAPFNYDSFQYDLEITREVIA